MSTWERPAAASAAAAATATREGKNQGRRKTPSFSSSLLDAIYHSIDVSEGKENERGGTENNNTSGLHGRRNHALKVEEEIANLRRAIMVEKWMENYPSAPASRASSRRVNSDSSSSTDSSFFSSSETESASKSSSSTFPNPKHEGKFIMRTKSRALKIYGDLKKVKQPISPGGKISNFLNSIFNSRNVKKHHHHHHHHHQGVVVVEDWRSTVRKSRSVNDSTPNRPPPAVAPPCSRTKSNKRSVRFCPVGVIVDEYSQPCGHMSIYNDDNDNDPSLTPIPSISSHYIKKNIDSFRNYEEKNPKKKHKYRGFYNDDDDDDSYDDGNSCTSSDLFELENIGLVGIGGGNREELPVYGTTNLKMNQAIAKGLLFV